MEGVTCWGPGEASTVNTCSRCWGIFHIGNGNGMNIADKNGYQGPSGIRPRLWPVWTLKTALNVAKPSVLSRIPTYTGTHGHVVAGTAGGGERCEEFCLLRELRDGVSPSASHKTRQR